MDAVSCLGRRSEATAARRLLELDGLRGIAILCVVFAHFHVAALKGGFFGVDLFFAISGMLFGQMLYAGHVVPTARDLVNLAIRRVGRVMPLHFFFLVCVCVALLVLRSVVPDETEARATWESILPSAAYALGYVRLATENPFSIVDHTWSLAVEVHLYLLVPFVVLLMRSRRSRLAVGTTALTVAMLVLAWRVHTFHQRPYLPSIYAQTDTRADGFLLGLAAACFLPYVARLLAGRLRGLLGPLLLACLALFFGLVLTVSIHTYGVLSYGLTASALLFAGTVALAGWLAPPTCTARRLLRTPPLVHLGAISFSLYLWHLPIQWFTQDLPLQRWPLMALQALLSLAAAEASFVFLEQPSHRWARSVASRVTQEKNEVRGPLAVQD